MYKLPAYILFILILTITHSFASAQIIPAIFSPPGHSKKLPTKDKTLQKTAEKLCHRLSVTRANWGYFESAKVKNALPQNLQDKVNLLALWYKPAADFGSIHLLWPVGRFNIYGLAKTLKGNNKIKEPLYQPEINCLVWSGNLVEAKWEVKNSASHHKLLIVDGTRRKDYLRIMVMVKVAHSVIKLPLTYKGDKFFTSLPLDKGQEELTLEVMAQDWQGPWTSYRTRITKKENNRRPKSIKLLPDFDGYQDSKTAELKLFSLTNKLRIQRGKIPLTLHKGLSHAAREHSRELAAGHISHHLPEKGSLTERLRAAGLYAPNNSENLAVYRSIIGAFDNLVSSPSHYYNLIDPKMRSTGIGVYFKNGNQGDKWLYITQLFADNIQSLPPFLSQLHNKILQQNPRLTLSFFLNDLANLHLGDMVRSGQVDYYTRFHGNIYKMAGAALHERGYSPEKIKVDLYLSKDINQMANSPYLSDNSFTHYGLDVQLAPHPDYKGNIYWGVIIFANLANTKIYQYETKP